MSKYTDKELLDALAEEGCGTALIHDDGEHWVVSGDGFQSVVVDGPKPFETSYMVDDEGIKLARKDIREAIAAWIDEDTDPENQGP